MENIKELTDQFTGSLKAAQEQAATWKKTQDELKAFMTPIEQKNVTLNGVNCVVQLYSDRVAIMQPLKEQNLGYYQRVEKIYELAEAYKAENVALVNKVIELTKEIEKPWYKKIIKWLK